METSVELWVALVVGGLPFLGLLLWWWNELWYVLPLKLHWSSTSIKLPPGHMGFPFFGEMLTFLWYFKIRCCPDDFINSKRAKYGDGIGMYRTYLFGSPSIITCSPEVNRFILQSENIFKTNWPNIDLIGSSSLVAVQGSSHARLRSYIVDVTNKPDALRRIAQLVQPRMLAAFQSWALKGRIRAYDQAKKVTFENIGKLFLSLEPGPLLDTIDNLFDGLLKGVRANPLNVPGFTYHYALQCRKKLEEIFRVELEKKRNRKEEITTDIMDGLIQIKDDEGNRLSDKEVIDNIIVFVIAGYATTAVSSMWAIFYLAKYPNVLQKLREENMIVSLNKNGEFITSDDVTKMKYTTKVVEEIIRLANVSPFLFRSVTKEIEYKGYTIPKNWNMLVWIRYLHTNPVHFDDPMCFNPDRWNNPAKPGTYQVFGGGARICAGNMLVRMQLAVFLHHLSVGYKWNLRNPNAAIMYLPFPRPVDNVEVTFSKL